MAKSRSFQPLIRQGWLRALLFFIAFGLASGIGITVYFITLHKTNPNGYGLQNLMNGGGILPVIGILFVLGLLVTYVFRRWIDRKTFISLGLDFNGHGREAIAGGMLAVFIICISSLLLKATGHLKWMDIIFDPKALFLAFGSTLVVAFYEELIFRGYILNNLMESFPKWLALIVSAALFMLYHLTSQASIGFFAMVNSLIMGLILGLNYSYSKNLWFSVFFHIGWKFLEGPVFGFSGDESFQTLLQPELNGDTSITGGTNGLEGSVILMAASLLSLVALYLFLQHKFNQQFRPVPDRI